jgi:Tfp pilus assembly protein PilO
MKVEITNRMVRLKESLGPKKLRMLYTCCALASLIILLFAYCPLMSKLSNAASRLGKMQAKLINQQIAITALDDSNLKSQPIKQNDLSLAIAELTEKGRTLGLSFSSIVQQTLQQTLQADIQRLPINFMIESEYKNIGLFLAYIDDTFSGVTEVESLAIRPREENSSKLSLKIILNLYVEVENAT